MPLSGRDLTSIKARFSPLTTSPSLPRIVPERRLRPSYCSSPCPIPLWYLTELPQLGGHLSPLLSGRPLHRPPSLKTLILLTPSFLTRAPWPRTLLLSRSRKVWLWHTVHTPKASSLLRALALKFQKLLLLPSTDSSFKLFPTYAFKVYFGIQKRIQELAVFPFILFLRQ